MARKCTICQHAEVAEINLALAGGASIRRIATQFDCGPSAVAKHLKNHLRPALASREPSVIPPDADPESDVEAVAVNTVPADPMILPALRCVRRRQNDYTVSQETLRQNLLRDLESLNSLIEQAKTMGNAPAMLAAMKIKYAIADRTGLAQDLDLVMGAGAARSPIALATDKQARLASIVADFANRLPSLFETLQPVANGEEAHDAEP